MRMRGFIYGLAGLAAKDTFFLGIDRLEQRWVGD